MAAHFNWGILGTGMIARQFAAGLRDARDARLVAVGSRAMKTANRFGDEFDVARRYDHYQALADDREIDAVYVATPHPLHLENMLMLIDAGKAVLCEKPFTLNAREAAIAIARAREKGVFVMEAMWTRFIPAIERARELIADGTIGDVRLLTVDFGFRTPFDPAHRLFDPALGGGALLDIGIYPVSLASMVFGSQPTRIQSAAFLGETGVDEQGAALFEYDDGALAQLSFATRTHTAQEATIHGTRGRIHITSPWWVSRRLEVTIEDKHEKSHKPHFVGNGYHYEAEEVARCVRAGMLESHVMPLDETLAIMETMDAIRAPWGLRYPSEIDTPLPADASRQAENDVQTIRFENDTPATILPVARPDTASDLPAEANDAVPNPADTMELPPTPTLPVEWWKNLPGKPIL